VVVKLQLIDIQNKEQSLSFDRDAQETTTLLADPRQELWGGEGGLQVRLQAQLVQETVLLRGELKVHLKANCVRCTTELDLRVAMPLDIAIFPRPEEVTEEEEVELDSDDLDLAFYEGTEIDLEPFVREAIFLEVPTYPACEGEEEAACAVRHEALMAKGQPAEDRKTDEIDPRWDALRALKAKLDHGEGKN
jgi:uncharacterized metal-binding protein YceD (DUF177 family)